MSPAGPVTSGTEVDRTFTPFHRGGSGPPVVLIHGFTDTWRGWEPILPELERHHDVLAVTQAGHAGGPAVDGPLTESTLPDVIEAAMDRAGFRTAHIVGNSLGGFVSLQLAERGRADSVVALAPAGGWRIDDERFARATDFFRTMRKMLIRAAPYADAIASTPEGRRRSTLMITENYEHLSPELIAHQIRGAAGCRLDPDLFELARKQDWGLDPDRIECPVRLVWGTEDRILPLPEAAVRFREEWVPQAEWIELNGVGHAPQLDVPEEAVRQILEVTGGAAASRR